MKAVEREKAIEWIAAMACWFEGIEPIDPADGSDNWWMFAAMAEKFVDQLPSYKPLSGPQSLTESRIVSDGTHQG